MKRRHSGEMGHSRAFIMAVGLSLTSFFGISLISALCSGFFENSRAGAEYLTLVTVLCSGFVTGFISRKILASPLPAMLSSGNICLIFAVLAAIVTGYSLGAFMNEITFFLLSLVGIFAARERKVRHRRR